jgi:hypothetical protein
MDIEAEIIQLRKRMSNARAAILGLSVALDAAWPTGTRPTVDAEQLLEGMRERALFMDLTDEEITAAHELVMHFLNAAKKRHGAR